MKECDSKIEQFISIKRFENYSNLDEYKKNIVHSKKMYIPLSLVEISLKNSISFFYTKRIEDKWLFDDKFLPLDLQKKVKIASEILRHKNKLITRDTIISELSFGFWVMLLKKYFSHHLRYADLKIIFPNLTSSKAKRINRHFIFTKLNNIRHFRNKVFHHDKIINKKEYENMINEIYEILSYFDDRIVDIAKELNND